MACIVAGLQLLEADEVDPLHKQLIRNMRDKLSDELRRQNIGLPSTT